MNGSKRPRLLCCCASPYRGGAEEYGLTIARAAKAAGFEVQASFPPTREMQSLVTDYESLGMRYHPLDVVEPDTRWAEHGDVRSLLAVWRTARRMLKDAQPDVVHLELGWPNRALGVQLACAHRRIPAAVVFQLVRDRHKIRPPVRRWYAWARSRSQKWVAVSENNRRLIDEGFGCPREDIELIYNGAKFPNVDESKREAARLRIRRELGLRESSRLLLTVGQLHVQKGYLDLVEIAPGILGKHPDVTMVWVGEGLYREQIEQKIASNGITGRVLLTGRRSDVPELLMAADLFVFPTRFEGLPFSLLEAAAHGLPIVTTAASSIPEILNDRVHGLVVPEKDPAALKSAIEWALCNAPEMKRFAAAARGKVGEFSEERMVGSTVKLLERLATQGR